MNSFRLKILAAACSLACAGAALAQGTAQSPTTGITTAGGGGTSAVYLTRTDSRFGGFTGSTRNTDSLARGLRTGSEVTLTGSGERVTFTPPTKPMGYGNVTRAMDLAQRDLAAAGITEPTPTEIKIAMMGGTLTQADGSTTTFDGVLKLRSEGMGWGQIAHTIGVHPGMGKPPKAAAPVAAPVSAAPGGSAAPAARSGIVTAGGASAVSNGHAFGHAGGGAVTTAAGASAGAGGITSAGAKGQGNAFGRGK